MKSRIIVAFDLCAALGAGSYFRATTQSENSVVRGSQNRIDLLIANNDGVPGGISDSNGRIEAERIEIGSDVATPLRHLTPDAGRALDMSTGFMGPKVMAACDFAGRVGVSGIGRLADALAMLDGTTGTRVPQES